MLDLATVVLRRDDFFLLTIAGYRYRHVLAHIPGCNDDAGGMYARMAGRAFQHLRIMHQVADFRILVLFERTEVRGLFTGFFERHAYRFRDHLCNPVGLVQGNIEDAGDIPDYRARSHVAKRDDLAHIFAAVLLHDVIDHPRSAPVVKIDVDIRHRDAFRIQKTLEDEVVLEGVDIRNAKAIRHGASRRRTPARAYVHPEFSGGSSNILHDKEVARKPHVPDDSEFMIEPLGNILTDFRIPLPGLLHDHALQAGVHVAVEFGGDGIVRHEHLDFRQLYRALVHDLACGIERCIARDRVEILERSAHFPGGFEEELVVVEAQPIRVEEVFPRLETQEHILRFGILLPDIVHIVCGDGGYAVFLCPAQQDGIAAFLLFETVILDLDVIILPEDVEPFLENGARFFFTVCEDRVRDFSLNAACRGDESLAVRAQCFLVDTRLVIMTVRKGEGGEFGQIPVALLVLGKEHLMVACSVGPVLHTGGRKVELASDDGLYAGFLDFFVKFRHPVEIAVIGNGHARHPQFLRFFSEDFDIGGPVE